MRHRFGVLVSVCAFMGAVGVPAALAFDCNPPNKPVGAGSVATIDASTGDVESFNKPNPGSGEQIHGGFLTIDFGGGLQFDTFVHAPQGELPPVREGGSQDNCDGKGLDAIDVCLGG
jgi:hypothetical protein